MLKNRWHGEGGYHHVLTIAFPLIISTGAWSIQHFVDRMFLTWYSPEALAASTPAGMLNFTIMCIFIGTGSYVNTFVAQYYGAKRYDRIGPAVWQGIYVSLIGGLCLLIIMPLTEGIFTIIGHDEAVKNYEIIYFRILCLGGAPAIASSVLSGFFSGRGRTWPVMWVNLLAIGFNLVFDYLLIFGNAGFPELGVKGAAIATVLAPCLSTAVYLYLLTGKRYRLKYNTLSGWRLDSVLFKRLMRFGFPNGVHLFLEVAGYTFFILLIGRKGIYHLAATNIAFNINTIAFLPMIGLGIAISILVGQYLGDGKPDRAEYSVFSGFHIALLYMTVIATLYVFVPGVFLAPFASQADPESFAAIREITVVLLRFVAFYSVFDALNIVFSYAIKGAGDTRFIMKVIIFDSLLVQVIPCYIFMSVLGYGIYSGWAFTSAFISILGIVFAWRFMGGKWKTMRVIENVPPIVPTVFPEAPVTEIEP